HLRENHQRNYTKSLIIDTLKEFQFDDIRSTFDQVAIMIDFPESTPQSLPHAIPLQTIPNEVTTPNSPEPSTIKPSPINTTLVSNAELYPLSTEPPSSDNDDQKPSFNTHEQTPNFSFENVNPKEVAFLPNSISKPTSSTSFSKKSSLVKKSSPKQKSLLLTNRGPFKCQKLGCHANFDAKHKLESHIITHTEVKPYNCKMCLSSFARQHDGFRHVRNIHGILKNFEDFVFQDFKKLNCLRELQKSHTANLS
ncbi:hypothetical protein HDU92_000328, partial [Lobulomyces angularis]